MLQFFDDSPTDLANRVISQAEVAPSWINMGVLAQLGNFKAELEEKVLGLSEQGASWFWSGSDFAIEYAGTRAIDFWQRLNGSEVAGYANAADGQREALYIDFLVATSCSEDHLECPTRIEISPPTALYSTEPPVSIVSGRCRRCFWGAASFNARYLLVVSQSFPVSARCAAARPLGQASWILFLPLPNRFFF